MTMETNKQIVRAFYDAINRGEFAALDQYCADDFIFYHQIDTPHPGVAGFVASEEKNFAAFDDWQMPVHDLIAEGDKVAAYLVFEGTHARELMGVAPKGNRIRFSLLMWLTLKDGKIVEKRAHFDSADIRRQLAA